MATQDTVIQLRATIRTLLAMAGRQAPELAAAVRTALTRDDEYASLGKPPCDWDDPAARDRPGRRAGEDGIFRIVRKVAHDRVISTVDTEARHGRKSRARTFEATNPTSMSTRTTS